MNFNKIVYDKDLLEDIVCLNIESSRSPVLGQYYYRSELWNLVKRSIQDDILIKLMIFNQDLNIAPLHTFIEYYSNEIKNMELSIYDKRCLGSFIKFIFMSLGYKTSKRSYREDSLLKYGRIFIK
ncbi:hypothetical protein [Haloplasma contractile]|uniref:Uncharacterized protein n=1 Tax=Haloplasma contractile SSD-17B TaxID=1033810 RepID=F7PWW0_9MOLU|nr:hypothetical protein [Haloplasma contractile]ERJ12513.1 hypothetical protein HLPCO_001499 [Haloplasma contractile SSD-17B]